jgi:hypothetical protein
MKKKDLKGLALNKKSVSNLNPQEINGGRFTRGCTDGCTPLQTAWNCSHGGCTNDCGGGASYICTTAPKELEEPGN